MRTDGAIITNAGQELLSYALANNKQVNFTKVKLGKGDVNTFDEAKKLTDVVSFYKQIPITSIARNNAGIVRIRSSFTNADFPLQVVLKEIGVFAVVEGKSEVLFGYVNDGEGESFPPGSSGNIVERVRDIYVGVSTTTQVTAVVDRSVVYATIYDLDEEIAKCAKKITRVNPGNGIHGGGTLGEDITISIKSNDTSINLDVTNGITLKKTDLTDDDSTKLFSAKGAFNLKTWLVTNYTTLMNNIRDTLTNMINLKLPHGGYDGTGQQLKNDIDTKVSKSGDIMTGKLNVRNNIEVLGGGNNFIAPNNYGYMGRLVDGTADYMLYMDTLDRVRLGFGTRRVLIQDSSVAIADGSRLYHQGFKPTKVDIGLDLVNNWDASSAVNDPSNSKYATPGAVKKAYDKGEEALTNSNTKVSKSGDTMSAALRFNSNHMIVYKDTYKGVYASAENIGFTTSGNDWAFYIDSNNSSISTGEIYANRNQKVYHPGNKPSASDINALPISGGNIKGDLGANRFIGENNFGFMNKKSDGTLVYSLLISTANKLHLGWANSIPIYIDSNSVEFKGGFTANADLNINAGSIKLAGGGKIYSYHNDLVSYKNTRKGIYASDVNIGLTDEESRWLIRCDNDKNIYDGYGRKLLTSGNTNFSKELLFSGVLTKRTPATLTKAITQFDMIYCYAGDNEDSNPTIYLPEDMISGVGSSKLFQCNYSDSNGGATNVMDRDVSYFRMNSANLIEFIYAFTNTNYIQQIESARINIVGLKYNFGG